MPFRCLFTGLVFVPCLLLAEERGARPVPGQALPPGEAAGLPGAAGGSGPSHKVAPRVPAGQVRCKQGTNPRCFVCV